MNFKKLFSRIRGVSLKEKIIFTRNLSLIIKAGLSLPQGLETLGNQTSSPLLKEMTGELRESIDKGRNLSEALVDYPSLFSSFYISMVKTAEVAGNLEETLASLAVHMEKERALRSRILSALMYPVIILVIMVIVIIIMMVVVVPKLSAVFKDFNVDLPATTTALIAVSSFFAKHSLLVIGGAAVILFLLWYIFRKTKKGKHLFDWIILKMPIMKTITKKINCARVARALQTLIKAGVGIVEALTITSDVVKNIYYQEALKTTGKEVEQGKQLHEILAHYPSLFMPLMVQLIAVGEETGSVDVILGELATSYEDEIDTITKNLPSIIEPVLMVFIGASVGFFAISMLQPIYTLTSSIKY